MAAASTAAASAAASLGGGLGGCLGDDFWAAAWAAATFRVGPDHAKPLHHRRSLDPITRSLGWTDRHRVGDQMARCCATTTIVRAAIVRAYRHGGIAWLDVPVLRLVRALGVVLERVGRGRVVEHCVRGRGRGAGVPAVGVALGACRQSIHAQISEQQGALSRVWCAAGCSAIVAARAEALWRRH